jgi:hypothetical protein
MPEAAYTLLNRLALLRIEIKGGFSKPQHFSQVEQVLLEHAANHDHVVQVYET